MTYLPLLIMKRKKPNTGTIKIDKYFANQKSKVGILQEAYKL